ncbi:MAG: peptidase U32 family protein [Actinomycetota bacterium]
MTVKRNVELLVPANNLNILKYAVNYGADAVYVGGKEFNLRSIHGNFTLEELKEGAAYAHKRGVKLYFTLNAILLEEEIENLKAYIEELKKIDIDAVIVSDLGVFSLVREIWPGIDVNISTQTNTTNSPAVNYWHRLGAKRVNIAREINFKDLEKIVARSSAEIEVFVHGAMCISYSGRCMLSKYMTGRDANRGRCAHSCRWKYYLMEEERPNLFFPIEQDKKGTYIYNSRDLCLLPKLDLLAGLGVHSFKIEGRMKTENYVSLVTWVYRKALDYIGQGNFTRENIQFLMSELDKCSHRNFTMGFMFLKDRQELEDNDNVGYIKKYRFVGVYEGYSSRYRGAVIKVKNQFRAGEEMDILQPGKDPLLFRIDKILAADGRHMEWANPNDTVMLPGTGQMDDFSVFRIKSV